MRKIPEDIIDDVNRIAEELVVYKNKKNLSWTGAYKDVLETKRAMTVFLPML